ncbi:unnamed protein product [Closterium sp. NIES-64]|nr:unnamed protein product [Closterium sp. NIES-64]
MGFFSFMNVKSSQLDPAGGLSGVRELETPSVRQAAEVALGGVRATARLTSAVAGTQDKGTGTSTPTPLTRSVRLTKLLGGRGLTSALLLLALTTTKAAPLHRATPTSSTAAAATAATAASSAPTATAAAASAATAATEAPTPATTPTATPTTSATSTATSTAPASSSSALAPLALAVAASPARGRRSADRLGANEVDIRSRGNRGQKGGGGAPLKEGGTRVTTRGSYSDYTLLSCKEALLKEVNGECGGANREEVDPDRAKGVREPGD